MTHRARAAQGGAAYLTGSKLQMWGGSEIRTCSSAEGGAVFASTSNLLLDGLTISACSATEKGASACEAVPAYLTERRHSSDVSSWEPLLARLGLRCPALTAKIVKLRQ